MKSLISVSFSPTSQIDIQCQCMWTKRSSQEVVNPGWELEETRVTDKIISIQSTQCLQSTGQSLHTSRVLIFQVRKLLAAYYDFSPTLFCREKQGCVCVNWHRQVTRATTTKTSLKCKAWIYFISLLTTGSRDKWHHRPSQDQLIPVDRDTWACGSSKLSPSS